MADATVTVTATFEVEVYQGENAVKRFHKRLEETNDPVEAAATELVKKVKETRGVKDTVPLRRAICASGDALAAIKRAAGIVPPPPAEASGKKKDQATGGDAK